VAALANDPPSRGSAVGTEPATDVPLCDSSQLELSIRASGFGAHVAALRFTGAQPCDVGELHITATVAGRNRRRISTEVAPPQQFSGRIGPGDELIGTFDYTMGCRENLKGPFSAAITAEGEVGAIRATSPVAFRRDPFTASC
jgi:hypothetical protein